MFETFFDVIFSGVFGPAIGRWLGKYKYWMVFLVITIAIYILFFVMLTIKFGVHAAWVKEIMWLNTPTGLLGPPAIGAIGVFIAFLNKPKIEIKNKDQRIS
jgi:hypothetical protein